MCMGHHEIKTPTNEKFIEKNRCIHTNIMLKNGLTRRHMVVIEDYNHLKTMDENVKWMKLTHLLSFFPLNLRGPFCTPAFNL